MDRQNHQDGAQPVLGESILGFRMGHIRIP